MKPETMNTLLWVIPILITIVGFFCVTGINLIIRRLTEISKLIQIIFSDNSATKQDVFYLKEKQNELKLEIKELQEKIHYLETRQIIQP